MQDSGTWRVLALGDHFRLHYASWLLSGVGVDVALLGLSPAHSSSSATTSWLAAGGYSVGEEPVDLVRAASAVDGIVVDLGDQATPQLLEKVQSLRLALPDKPLVVMSPVGIHGPLVDWKASQREIQALAGLMSMTGSPDTAPQAVGGQLIDAATGTSGALAMLLGLRGASRGHKGALLDVSALETTVGLQASRALVYAYTGLVFRRGGDAGSPDMLAQDGYVHLGLWFTPLLAALDFLGIHPTSIPIELLTLEDQAQLFRDPRLLAEFESALRADTKMNWTNRGQARRIPVTPVLGPRELLSDPHLVERNYFHSVEVQGRQIQAPSRPFLAPFWRSERLKKPVDTGTLARLPLEGVNVLEFGTAWTGPIAATSLALYGAKVTKVESPTYLDRARGLPLMDLELREPWFDYSYNYNAVNAGKRHLVLDLTTEAGGDIGRRLLDKADVVIVNYSPRAARNLGLDASSVLALNPRCIVASASAFGATGPYRDYVSFGSGMEGMVGLSLSTGSGSPVRAGTLYHPDVFSALHLSFAIVAALMHRDVTGRGYQIDLSQLECGALATTNDLIAHQLPNPTILEFDTWTLPCLGDDEWISVTSPVGDRAAIETIIRAPGGSPGDDLAKYTSQWDKHNLAESLQEAGIAAAPLLRSDEVLLLPHLAARDSFLKTTSQVFGERYAVGKWHNCHELQLETLGATRPFGADNGEVLADLLGLTSDEIHRACARGAVASSPIGSDQVAAASSPVAWMVSSRMVYRRDDHYLARLGLVRNELPRPESG